MAIRAISKMGHPVLRRKAREVSREELLSPEMQLLIDDMADTMRDAEGVGLAAPQVYESVRLLVAEVPGEDPENPVVPLLFLANPEIIEGSEEGEYGWEGCLSIPNVRGVVPRHQNIVVRGLSREGRPVTVEAEGYFARILQHEIDHLDGILYLDRMDDMRTLTFQTEYERYWAPVSNDA